MFPVKSFCFTEKEQRPRESDFPKVHKGRHSLDKNGGLLIPLGEDPLQATTVPPNLISQPRVGMPPRARNHSPGLLSPFAGPLLSFALDEIFALSPPHSKIGLRKFCITPEENRLAIMTMSLISLA